MKQKQEVFKGIILRGDRHKENDLRLTVLTDSGLKTLFATGVLKPTAKLKGALQLFNLVEFTVTGQKVISAHVIHNSIALTKEVNRFYLAGLVSKTLTYLARELSEQEFKSVYALTASTYIILSTTDISCYKIFIFLFGKFLFILGYSIEQEHNIQLDKLMSMDVSEIDSIELTLSSAKSYIRLIAQSFLECLDYELDVAFLLK